MMHKATIRRGLTTALLLFLVATVAGGLIVIYHRFSPTASVFFPKCPFLLLTGQKCPGCGSQRAIHALLHANVVSAFTHNALLVVSLPYVALQIFARLHARCRPSPTLLPAIESPRVIRTIIILVLAFWIARNVFGF